MKAKQKDGDGLNSSMVMIWFLSSQRKPGTRRRGQEVKRQVNDRRTKDGDQNVRSCLTRKQRDLLARLKTSIRIHDTIKTDIGLSMRTYLCPFFWWNCV